MTVETLLATLKGPSAALLDAGMLKTAVRFRSPTLPARGVQYGLQPPSSQFGSVLRARREAPVVYVDGDATRVVGRYPGATSSQTGQRIGRFLDNSGGAPRLLDSRSAGGLAFGGDRPFSLVRGSNNVPIARHETGHQIVRALREGSVAKAPILARSAAYLQNSKFPGMSGLGEFLDETYARAAQGRRTSGGGSELNRWLFNPGQEAASYGQRFGPLGRAAHRVTTTAGLVYRKAPTLALASGVTAAGVGYENSNAPVATQPIKPPEAGPLQFDNQARIPTIGRGLSNSPFGQPLQFK